MSLKFVVTALNKPDVLARVVMLFHRSAVEIESIHMPARRKKSSDLRIMITVDGRHANVRRIAAILEKAAEVLSVETILPRARLAQGPVTPSQPG